MVQDFDKLTNGYFESYVRLCGLVFRSPDDDLSDAYWDDDYTENISVKNWLKKKYQAPFKNESIGDTWLGNQWRIRNFKKDYPEIKDTDLLRRISREYTIEEDFNYLSERLTLGELLLPAEAPRDAVDYWISDIFLKEENLKKNYSAFGTNEEKLRDAAKELRDWRKSRDQLDRMKWLYPDTYRKDVRKQTGLSYKELMEQHEEAISYETMRCEDLFHRWNITLDPYFSELYYSYDYGDDWAIKITVENVYNEPL